MTPLILAGAYYRASVRKLPFEFPSIIKGTAALGYMGRIPANDLIGRDELMSLSGLTAPAYTLLKHEEWLGFSVNGKSIAIARQSILQNIGWDKLNVQGLVFGKEININGRRFKCRLMRGGNADPASRSGGEWDSLIYRVAADGSGEWDQLTLNDLGIGAFFGRQTVCQESSTYAGKCIVRGDTILTGFFNSVDKSTANPYLGWRPVLELIE